MSLPTGPLEGTIDIWCGVSNSPWLHDVIDVIDWSQPGGWRLPTHMELLRPLVPLVDAKSWTRLVFMSPYSYPQGTNVNSHF
jgi:hypothetical protein